MKWRPKTTRTTAVLLTGLLAATGCEGSLGLNTDPADPIFDGPARGGTNGPTDPAAPRPRASLHRLNRLEYNNTVRDLLGTSLRPADAFPPDASVGGFDNDSSALGITPALMDRYVDAARAVVEDAFAARPAFAERLEEDDPRLTYTIDRDANRIGGIVRLRGGGASGTLTVPTAGAHTVVVRAQGMVNGGVAAPNLRLTLAGQVFDFAVPVAAPADIPFAVQLEAGQHAIAIQATNFEENAAENRGNDILFDFVDLRSDQLVEGPGRARVLSCALETAGCADTVVLAFARRAWRRPLNDAERVSLTGLLAAVQAEGENPEESVKLVLRAILTSPKFLHRYRLVEDADSAELLDPFVLASRLSYFIWSSTPDDRLLAAAEDGTLGSADGIRATVTWMLADPRAGALADGFVEQWLDLRHLEQAAPSADAFPEFNEQVRAAMAAESKLFFLDYLDNRAPLGSMLKPDFAYRDATLAAHLGVAGPDGEGFERVPVGAGDRRGVLALSAWLTARSESDHSSPIRRGSWVADQMLCSPVPPPPPGLEVGQLPEASTGLSVRARLEQHRNDPACSSCHAYLDVLGMGFEVYDGVGRYIDDATLDSRGELPGVAEFRGADGMADVLDPATFVTCVSKKLFTYALGRPVEFNETANMAELAEPRVLTLTLPDLITAIAVSPAFSQPTPLE